MANNAPVSASSMMSPVELENSTLTPLAGHRLGGGDDQLERQDDQAEADEYPAELAEAGLFAAEEENHAEEDQQWRKPRQVEVSTRAISAVPTSAPSMIARAGASAIRPWATKEVASRAVALLLCTRAVTPMPAANASGRLLREVYDARVRQMAASGELRALYQRWNSEVPGAVQALSAQ